MRTQTEAETNIWYVWLKASGKDISHNDLSSPHSLSTYKVNWEEESESEIAVLCYVVNMVCGYTVCISFEYLHYNATTKLCVVCLRAYITDHVRIYSQQSSPLHPYQPLNINFLMEGALDEHIVM